MSYGRDKQKTPDEPGFYSWLIGIFIIAQFAAAFFPNAPLLSYSYDLNLYVFGSMYTTKLFWGIIAILHVFEAFVAWFFVKTMDPPNASRWFWQTLWLGIFSLRHVIKRIA